MDKGSAFLSDLEETPSGKLKRHLRIIITSPDRYNQVLVVSVTSLRILTEDRYKECIIKKGEHPFIKHDSLVDFSRIQLLNEELLEQRLEKGWIIKKEDVSSELLLKIQKACASSIFVPKKYRPFFSLF